LSLLAQLALCLPGDRYRSGVRQGRRRHWQQRWRCPGDLCPEVPALPQR